jgi:hypothetical protein
MIVYDYAFLGVDEIVLDDKTYNAIFGKHEIYIPELEQKLIFSIRGKIIAIGKCRFKDEMIENQTLFQGTQWTEVYLESIVNEYSLLKYMANKNLCPSIGDMIFIRNIFSDIGEYGILDEVGMFGYEMKDLSVLKPGIFDSDIVKKMVKEKIIEASPGALNDLTNISRKNLVNGYCIDVRRSFRYDLPFYNNFKFNGEKIDVWNDIRSVLDGQEKN